MGEEETFYYYAYGSNLLKQRILLKNHSAKYVDIGKLDDHLLTFDMPFPVEGSRWRGAAATIRKCPGDHVWGTVWSLNKTDISNLDAQERIYFARDVNVNAPSGRTYSCRVYEMEGEFDFAHTPSPQYLDVIVRGAKQSGLPVDYIEKLENISTNGYAGDVPIYREVLQELQQESH